MLLIALATTAAAETVNVGGQVLGPDGAPVAGCRVVALGKHGEAAWSLETAAGANGRFVFMLGEQPPSEPVAVVALHAGLALDAAVLMDGEEATLRLGAHPLSLAGQVQDSAGKPLADVEIAATSLYLLAHHGEEGWAYWRHSIHLQGPDLLRTRTDAGGHFAIAGLPEKTYVQLTSTATGYLPWEDGRTMVTTGAKPLAVVLAIPGSLSGHVTRNGHGVAGVRVGAGQTKGPEGYPQPSAVTGPDGAYFIPQVAPGTHTVALQEAPLADTALALSGVIVVSGRRTESCNLRLIPAAFITGTVRVRKTHEPLAGMRVFAVGPANPRTALPRYVTTDATGTYRLPVAPGLVEEIGFGEPSGVSTSYPPFKATSRAGETRTGVDWDAPASGPRDPVRGQVLLPDRTPAAGAKVYRSYSAVMNVPELEDEVIADAHGRFVLPRELWEEGGWQMGLLALDAEHDLAAMGYVPPGQPVTLRLQPAAHAVTTFVNAAGGPVPAFDVYLYTWEEGFHRQANFTHVIARSDADGHVRIPLPPGVNVEIMLRGAVEGMLTDNWAYDDARLHLAPGQEVRLPDRHLDSRGQTVRGTVVDAAGRPVAGAVIYPPWMGDLLKAKPCVTDARGRFVMTKLPAWPSLALIAFHPTRSLAARVQLNPQGGIEPQIVLQPTGSVRGQLLGLDGKPIAGAVLSLYADGAAGDNPELLKRLERAGFAETSPPTGADGRFYHAGLIAGETYHLYAKGKDFRERIGNATVQTGEAKDLGKVRRTGVEA